MKDSLQHRCKSCISVNRIKYKDKINATNREYYHRNSVEILEKRRENPDKSAQNKCSKKYRKENPNIIRYLSAKKRAAKLQRTPKWLTDFDREHIKAFYTAAVLMTKELGVKMVVDHIIPLRGASISGLHVPDNLQVITERENAQKSNKWG